MIRSYQDYRFYLEADRIASGLENTLRNRLRDEVWAFQRKLRRAEYLINCRKHPLRRWLASYLCKRLGRKLGFTIPVNVFGPGLAIAHAGTIVINSKVRIGANCRIHVCVNIGANAGEDGVPIIGDNCYIGPGAIIFGDVQLGDDLAIGANSVVNKSFPLGNMTIAGAPARKISDKTSARNLVKGSALATIV